MPIHAVPKPGTNKYRLVTDHSAGKHTLNSMILHEDIAGVTLDNVHDLTNGLRVFCHRRPFAQLNIWKADVSEAYRHMSMHPLWQIKQVVSFSKDLSCVYVIGHLDCDLQDPYSLSVHLRR
jgi:hypothetical protein